MFGFFALGVLLGLFFGAVIAAIVMFVVIKCCDKGKMAPYYMVSYSLKKKTQHVTCNFQHLSYFELNPVGRKESAVA